MITLKLAREGSNETVPLRLPATPGEAEQAFAMLNTLSPYIGDIQIVEADSDIPGLANYLINTDIISPDSMRKLNRLSEKLDDMDKRQHDIFAGALEARHANNLDDVLCISDFLEDYTFVPNVRSDEDLGRYVAAAGQIHGDRRFPEEAWPYLDFAKIGEEYFSIHGGAYTSRGYVMLRRENGEPSQESRSVLQMRLFHGQRECRLDLPADEARLEAVKRLLGIEDLAQASIGPVTCMMEPLAGLLPMDCIRVEDANELAQVITEMPDDDLLKYLAIIFVEQPSDFPSALHLSLELDDYERVPQDLEEYGRQVLERLGADEELLSAIDGYMNFEQLGEDAMKEDGVRQTEYGAVRRLSQPFEVQNRLCQGI